MNHADKTKIIRVVSDNPGITCKDLAEKTGMKEGTVKYRLIELEQDGKIFRQNKGCSKLIFTAHAADAKNVPDVYAEKPEKTVLELQMMFNRLYRGLAL